MEGLTDKSLSQGIRHFVTHVHSTYIAELACKMYKSHPDRLPAVATLEPLEADAAAC